LAHFDRVRHKHDSDLYDWVSRQIDLPLISITGEKLDELDFRCGYKDTINNICDFLDCEGIDEYTVECFLSNKFGQPLSIHKALKSGALLCKEMEQALGRRDVEIHLPNGKTVILQAVKVLVKGYVGVSVLDATGAVICRTRKGIHFATVETFYLCAPKGTHVDCDITSFECDAILLCKNSVQTEFEQLDLSISLCIDVQMVTHRCYCSCNCKKCCHCHSRKELEAVTVCPERKFPPNCPQIFPGHN
jgi:hypothetical protein